MIEVSNTTAQTLTTGQAITFDKVIFKTGCGECHRTESNSVKLRANGVYEIAFSANIGATTATTAAQLTIQLGGENLNDGTMISTTSAAGDLNNVSKTIGVRNCCGDYDRITVVNTGTASINVGAGASLFIKRVS